MKIIKGILIALVTIVILVAAVGFFLPSHIHVERSLTINAPSETIHAQINNLKNWTKWSPWYKMDTAMKIEYNGTEAGAGASYKWSSENKNVGTGDMTITSSTPDSISTAMNFMENGVATAKFAFGKSDTGTKVTWSMECNMGMNPVKRIFGLFMDKMLGPDFEKGLASIKQVAEAVPVKPKSKYEVMEMDLAEKFYIIKKDSVGWGDISVFYQTNFPALFEALGKAKIEMAGSVAGLFFKWDTINRSTIMAVAVPVKGDAKTKVKGYETLVIPSGKNLHIVYMGGYHGIGPAHMAMDDYMQEKNLLQGAPIIEEYVTDPGKEPDSTKWLTNIYYPVK